MVAMVVVWFFLFVCEFGYDCGLRLKWWFRSCGCGHRGFRGCGYVRWWFFFFSFLRWVVVEVFAIGVVVGGLVAG